MRNDTARAQTLADGVLIDAGAMAREAGFRWPVAVTAGAWADCVTWSDADSERQTHQDQSGRLWDVLFMAAHAVRNRADAGAQLLFELYRVPRDGRSTEAERTKLKLVVGPGDDGEPVMTITAAERGLTTLTARLASSPWLWVKVAPSSPPIGWVRPTVHFHALPEGG